MGESREGLGHVDRFLQVRFHTFYNLGIEEVFLWKFNLYMTPVSIFVNKLLGIRLRLGSMTMDIGAGTVLTVTTAPHSSHSILRVQMGCRWSSQSLWRKVISQGWGSLGTLRCRGRKGRNGLDIKWGGEISCLRCDVCVVVCTCSCVGVCAHVYVQMCVDQRSRSDATLSHFTLLTF